MKTLADIIYTILGLLLVISTSITIIGLIAYVAGVLPERIVPVVSITTLVMVLCTLVGLWKKQVFVAAFGWMLPWL